MASVEVTGHELRETQGTPPFVAYTIVVTPSGEGEPYSTTRRWNDLRKCHDALRAAGHGSRLSTLPKVEAHSLRMLLPGAAQDKVFRDERATQMQEFVNAACTAFDVVIDAAKQEEGPAPLLDFLRRDVPEPGVEPTPQHEKASHDGIASDPLSSPVRPLGPSLASTTPSAAEAAADETAAAASAVAEAESPETEEEEEEEEEEEVEQEDEKKEDTWQATAATAAAPASTPEAPATLASSTKQPQKSRQPARSPWMPLLWATLLLLCLAAIFAKEVLGVVRPDLGPSAINFSDDETYTPAAAAAAAGAHMEHVEVALQRAAAEAAGLPDESTVQ